MENNNLNKKLLLSIVVPTYNSEKCIEEFYKRTKAVVDNLSDRFNYEIIYINDFSKDNTYTKLRNLANIDNNVKLINFSRNFGNQIAISAGIDFAKGDIVIIIDDDLQDPPEIIPNFISLWDKGFKVVYGVRPKRLGVGIIFKLIAKIYYRVISFLGDVDIPNDTGDFRLIDKVVIEKLRSMKEKSRYYRGMVSWVGFHQTGFNYERDKRHAGKSSFSFKKYVNFALHGLTSFSDKPLYLSSLLGIFIAGVGFLMALILIINKIIDPAISIKGWTSIITIILFLSGIQLFSIGIVGIYIGKIYQETRNRPLYIIDETVNLN